MNNKFLQFLGLTKRAGKLREGYNTSEDIIKHRKAKLIVISEDASENTKNKFKAYCNKYNIAIIVAYGKEELGQILGRSEVNVVCITDEKMSNKLIELWNEKI
jgi:ribosomal protein L7Ae-like RNA K-turn-binding protein